ncbi:uncharacterized protein [Oryza sativa Japonica Group]|uniref:uncharacterized protein isoform X3 n=1 Tax=Oryza sativa subsp. japonica TaxID=39947 RepID=UPI000E1B6194|nr:OTU domain-containing protein 6A isoform X3 [Oryza sativa Japonica Group]
MLTFGIMRSHVLRLKKIGTLSGGLSFFFSFLTKKNQPCAADTEGPGARFKSGRPTAHGPRLSLPHSRHLFVAGNRASETATPPPTQRQRHCGRQERTRKEKEKKRGRKKKRGGNPNRDRSGVRGESNSIPILSLPTPPPRPICSSLPPISSSRAPTSLVPSLPHSNPPSSPATTGGGGGKRRIAARRMSDRELRPLRSIRITGDGRCLFRSVAYGACLRRGKQSPSDSIQKELADELRSKVADEFVRRRGDTEWFLEGDFESYVRQIRKPHVWGGEPELLMCSHVLRMPITVYMYTKGSDSPRIIAEYGQEYGKDNPICVLYDGYGHYDALQPSLSSF